MCTCVSTPLPVKATGVRSLRSGVSGTHEAVNVSSGNRPWVFYKSSGYSSEFQLLNIGKKETRRRD